MASEPNVDLSEIARVCERFGVASLRVTGAALTDGEVPSTSSLTFLVEFRPDAQRDFGTFFTLGDELQRIVGRPVELFDRRTLRGPDSPPAGGETHLVYPV